MRLLETTQKHFILSKYAVLGLQVGIEHLTKISTLRSSNESSFYYVVIAGERRYRRNLKRDGYLRRPAPAFNAVSFWATYHCVPCT